MTNAENEATDVWSKIAMDDVSDDVFKTIWGCNQSKSLRVSWEKLQFSCWKMKISRRRDNWTLEMAYFNFLTKTYPKFHAEYFQTQYFYEYLLYLKIDNFDKDLLLLFIKRSTVYRAVSNENQRYKSRCISKKSPLCNLLQWDAHLNCHLWRIYNNSKYY